MKNKYELFNEINISSEDYEIKQLSQEKKEDLFNNVIKDIKFEKVKNKKTYKKIAIASVLCLVVSIGVLSNDNVMALVENIGKQIESYFGKKENEYKGYKVEVNQVCEDKNIKVNLNEALLDDGNILLSMNLDTSNFDESKLKKGLFSNKIYYLPEATVYMNGMKFVETGGATRYEKELNKKYEFLTSLNLDRLDTNDDGKSDITGYQILDNIDPNKDYTVKIVFDEVGVQKVGLIPRIIDDEFEFINGNWEFEFKVNGKNIIGETKIYDINKVINVDENDFKAEINIKQLRVSPVSIKLTYTTKMGDKYNFENRNIEIELIDQDGNTINVGGYSEYSENETYMKSECYGNLENNQKLESIKILPYQYYREKDSDNPKYHHRTDYEDKSITIDLNK